MSGKIPTLEFDQLPESIATLLEKKYQRLGYLGEFFAKMAHQEASLKTFIEFTDAELFDVPYERNQHERLSLKIGQNQTRVENVQNDA